MEEVQEPTIMRMASYQQKVAQYYNARVCDKIFKDGDLVLRQAKEFQPTNQRKLTLNWEGPYRVEKII